jgi:A/G-specific adenine glycosylase
VKKTSEPFENTTRYYRGRIIETLRELPEYDRAGIPLTELGLKVQEGFTPEKIPWLRGLVEGLQRDGLAFIAEDSALYDAGSDASEPNPRVRLP